VPADTLCRPKILPIDRGTVGDSLMSTQVIPALRVQRHQL
jgi:hypothetical protein